MTDRWSKVDLDKTVDASSVIERSMGSRLTVSCRYSNSLVGGQTSSLRPKDLHFVTLQQ